LLEVTCLGMDVPAGQRSESYFKISQAMVSIEKSQTSEMAKSITRSQSNRELMGRHCTKSWTAEAFIKGRAATGSEVPLVENIKVNS